MAQTAGPAAGTDTAVSTTGPGAAVPLRPPGAGPDRGPSEGSLSADGVRRRRLVAQPLGIAAGRNGGGRPGGLEVARRGGRLVAGGVLQAAVELLDPLADGLSDLGNPLGAKHQHQHQQQDQDVAERQVSEHARLVSEYRSGDEVGDRHTHDGQQRHVESDRAERDRYDEQVEMHGPESRRHGRGKELLRRALRQETSQQRVEQPAEHEPAAVRGGVTVRSLKSGPAGWPAPASRSGKPSGWWVIWNALPSRRPKRPRASRYGAGARSAPPSHAPARSDAVLERISSSYCASS